MSTRRGRAACGSSRRTAEHLGTIRPPEALTNVGWGEDGRTLYITGRTALYRIRLSARGATQ